MRKRIKPSIIATKITQRMLAIYLSIYFGILIILIGALLPALYKDADIRVKNTLSIMYNNLVDELTSLDEYSDTLYYSYSLGTALEKCHEENNVANKALVQQALSSYVASNYKILAATIEDEEHHFYSAHYFTDIVNQEFLKNDEIYQKYLSYSNGSYFSYYGPELFYIAPSEYLDFFYSYHVLALTKVMHFNGKKYVVRTYYDINSLISDFQLQSEGILTDYAILSSNALVYSSKNNFETEFYKWKEAFLYNHFREQKFHNGGMFYYQKNQLYGWSVVVYSSLRLFFRNAFIIIGTIGTLYFISPILYGLFLRPMTAKLLAPLRQLRDNMQKYSAGDEITEKIQTGDEIEDLSVVFNQMTTKIKNQIEDIQSRERENSIVHYKLLTTQLDPHFVYNTMNIINVMARQGKNEEIIEINSALIRILRERLSAKLSVYTTLQNELETLREYDLIMQYRYDSKIQVQIEVDKGLLFSKVPKNILQPLVENAFYHGFPNGPQGQNGNINLLIYSLDDRIEIEVNDDGVGITPEKLQLLQNHSYRIYEDQKPHIGIDNVRQRLEYLYDGNYGFEIISSYGYGTTISISVPLETI